ncbi:MAG: DUF1554 domain-containing protein, partial [Neisseriaceae bacterium]
GGNGTLGNPYQVQQVQVGSTSTPSTLTYTISNNGTVPATSFYIDGTASQGWSYSGCGTQQAPITLNATESCTLTFTLNKANLGVADLVLSSLTMHWIDQDSPSGQTQGMSGTAYTNVYAAPLITLSAESASIIQGESATVTFTLTGGYNVANQTISFGSVSPAESTITYTNNPCSVSTASPSCNITVNTTDQTQANTYNLAITNAGNLSSRALQSTNYTIVVANAPKLIFVTESAFTGNLGGITGADEKCESAAIMRGSAGIYKALISDASNRSAIPLVNWVLKPRTTYFNESNLIIGITTDSSVFDFPLLTAVTPTLSFLIFTGLNWDWTSSTNNCNKWISDSQAKSASMGVSNGLYSDSLTIGAFACSSPNTTHLYCVQQ